MSLSCISLVLIGTYLLTKGWWIFFIREDRRYPPGPRALPIIGNILDLPRQGDEIWSYWKKFKDAYGPISSLKVLNKVIIIINDVDTAYELLDKRAKNFSDRPTMTFSGEMLGWNNSPTHMSYSERLLKHRKQLHQIIGTKNGVSRFNHLQEVEIRRFLLRTLNKSTEFFHNIKLMLGTIILNMGYGYVAEHQSNDPFIAFFDQVTKESIRAAEPGKWLVDIFPILRHVPSWVPGAEFKRIVARFRRNLFAMIDTPFLFVKRNIENGTARPSLVSLLLESGDLTHEDEEIVKWTAGILYAAGVDTTAATLQKFFLVMAMFPEVQKKCQREIDAVIGRERFPTSDDRENLPYVGAMIKEIIRWNAIVPVGLPRAASEDTEYNGYFIPKGATIITNIWGLLHDPQYYSDPLCFRPERFLSGGHVPEMDPCPLIFGLGRRTCPGEIFAEATIYLSVVMCLTVFNIEKPVSGELKASFTPGIVRAPIDFEVVCKPRSEYAEGLIRSIGEEHPPEKSSTDEIKDALAGLKYYQ